MQVQKKKSGNSYFYYILKSFRNENGKSTTKIVEKVGREDELRRRLGIEDVEAWVRARAAELTAEEKALKKERVAMSLNPGKMIGLGVRRSCNAGYLFLQKIYYDLGLDKICEDISKRNNFEYDLNDILSTLVYTRVLFPGSKRSAVSEAEKLLDVPDISLEQVYRALSVLSGECDAIQAAVYKNSLKVGERNSRVVYYDCTNYYFETEEASGLRQYGVSKEHRPNPIVQMGMFLDADDIPMAFCINGGSANEQASLRPLEKKLKEDFGLSKLVICTDAGLSSKENRRGDGRSDRAFITVQSLKKLNAKMREWALDKKGWKMRGADGVYDLSKLDPSANADRLFYKERWIKDDYDGFEQRLIVTFSFKYRSYMRRVRSEQVGRAEKLIRTGRAGRRTGQNDPRRFIEQTGITPYGEVASRAVYSIDREAVEKESRFDGFYAICTDLEDDPADIIRINGGRWRIENAFRIMKSEFEARPVYLQRDDRIRAHFLTCFLALLIYKLLEKRIERHAKGFTPESIIGTLRDMNLGIVDGVGFTPVFKRTALTDALHSTVDFRLDYEVIPGREKQKIITLSKRKSPKKRNRKKS